jgi:hypothetical protein
MGRRLLQRDSEPCGASVNNVLENAQKVAHELAGAEAISSATQISCKWPLLPLQFDIPGGDLRLPQPGSALLRLGGEGPGLSPQNVKLQSCEGGPSCSLSKGSGAFFPHNRPTLGFAHRHDQNLPVHALLPPLAAPGCVAPELCGRPLLGPEGGGTSRGRRPWAA